MLLPRTALLLAAGLGACAAPHGAEPRCTEEYRPGLLVHVRDAATRWPLASTATAIARDGTFVDTLHHADFAATGVVITLAGAYERPGTYAVWVEHPGYLPQERLDASVSGTACGVRTLTLFVDLVRE